MTTMPILAEGAAALGLPLSAAQLAQFQQYHEMLVEWNARMNLTAILAPDAVQVRHFLDSLTVAVALARWEGRDQNPAAYPTVFTTGGLADLGTGAGFPGVPLKILWPQMPLTLVESVGKK